MFRSTAGFDRLLEKATSNLKLEPDWVVTLQICDVIRQGDVPPKHALASIKKKMTHSNPHVAMFALDVLESTVKNCGSIIHNEVATKSFMEQLKEVVKTSTHENVKSKILELIQNWAYAFRNSPKYRAVPDTLNIMKTEGYQFPKYLETDAMFSADTAPEWADGDCCHRCRVVFSIVQRKHHCRACGQVFCSQCSSKSCTLPKFGIEKEVRVCEACFENVNKPASSSSKTDDLPIEYLTSSLAQQSQAPPPRKSEAELKEEEELQLAIALSQSEAEQKNKSKINAVTTKTKSYSPPPKLSTSPESDPELARYLNRNYWQQQSTEFSNASAPAMTAPPKHTSVPEQNGVEDIEMEDFVGALQSQVEIFVNRMKSNSSRGRSIANDSSVQTLFMNITAMHSKLLRYIQQQDDRRVYYEGLQDKLTQVKDARAALDALRDEHMEKLRREAEIAERQRQMQMAHKLDIMRQKKQEYLQYQRQLALQRIQEQEREMQIRQEQQKQQYLMGTQYATLPYMRQGYDMHNRFAVPNPQQSAQPFSHFPPPPSATSLQVDPSQAMMGGQPRSAIDQQSMMMRNQQGMMPNAMVPPSMMSMGHHMPMIGQHNHPVQGVQHMPSQLGINGQPMQGPPPMMGSQTLPRSLGQTSQPSSTMSNSQSLQEPTMTMQGQISMVPQQIQPPMSVPQQMPAHAQPMSTPQQIQRQQPQMNTQQIPGQLSMNGSHIISNHSAMGLPPHAAMNNVQPVQGQPGMLPIQLTGQSLSQTSLSQNMQPMMGVQSAMTQQSFSQQQLKEEEATAELISFD